MRDENWPEILNETIEKYRYSSFEWGKNDCAHFASNVVKSYTGIDYARHFRYAYKNEIHGYRTLKTLGYKSLADLVNSLLPQIGLVRAQRGDVVMYKKSLGICMGEQSAFLWECGLILHPTLQCDNAWRIE